MSSSYRHGSGSSDRYRDDRHRSRRSPSPGPSRSPKPRDPDHLPESFGRVSEPVKLDDDLSVLQRMKTSYKQSPLADMYKYTASDGKIKVTTRNHKDVRGVVTGYLICFDKHWNLVMKDCHDIYHKSKKSKTPFLRSVAGSENLPDFPPRVPKKKSAEGSAKTDSEPPAEATAASEKAGKGKKKRAKKAKFTIEERFLKKLFIRGDNIVMVCPLDECHPRETETEGSETEGQDE